MKAIFFIAITIFVSLNVSDSEGNIETGIDPMTAKFNYEGKGELRPLDPNQNEFL